MSTKPTIQTRCPQCDKAYDVPAKALGRRARCTGCNSEFRVGEPRPRHPTEEDILRWLSEVEDPDILDQPTVIGRREDREPETPPVRQDSESGVARRLDGHSVEMPGTDFALGKAG